MLGIILLFTNFYSVHIKETIRKAFDLNLRQIYRIFTTRSQNGNHYDFGV